MEGNEDIFRKLMGDADFRSLASEHLLNKVYKALRDNEKPED